MEGAGEFFIFIPMVIQSVLFIFGGAILGWIFWKKKWFGLAYAGFGHFVGVLVALLVTMWVSRDDGSLGIAIIVIYPFFTCLFIIIGALVGRSKQKQVQLIDTREDDYARINK